MTLQRYREEQKLSYRKLAAMFGIPVSLIHRACNKENYCLKLQHAHTIVKVTEGAVSYEDLLGGC